MLFVDYGPRLKPILMPWPLGGFKKRVNLDCAKYIYVETVISHNLTGYEPEMSIPEPRKARNVPFTTVSH